MSLNIHPNTVTILSIFLGIAAGIMFVYQDLLHNIIGVLLLVWANIYDSCDGQLARMTGKKTRWGRLQFGFALGGLVEHLAILAQFGLLQLGEHVERLLVIALRVDNLCLLVLVAWHSVLVSR